MKKHSSFRFRVSALLLVLFAAAFLLPASRTGNSTLYLLSAAVPGVMLFLLFLPAGVFALDRPSLSSALPLCGFGLLSAAYISPENTLSQGMRCVAALFFLAAGAVLIRAYRPSLPAAVLPAVIGLGMLLVPMAVPSLPFSLSEGGMAVLLVSVTAFLSLRRCLPALVVSLGGTLLLLFGQDYAGTAVWGIAYILVFWAASDSILWSGISLGSAVLSVGLYFGLVPSGAGSSVPSLLPRISGMPLILPESMPEAASMDDPESLFFLFGEQYGLVFLLIAVLLLIMLLVRGASLALHARKSFHTSLALGIILLFGLRTLCFLGASSDLFPFSPGAFPFLTSSAPDLFAHFFLLGLLSGIAARNETDLEEDARLAMLAH